jgi:hypothetical protein
MPEDGLPYSYHTFLFPFIWKTSEDKTREDFEQILSVGIRWIDTSWRKEEIRTVMTKDEWFQDYAAFQYFTKAANNVIFNTQGDNVVKCYQYYKNSGRYIISKRSGVYDLKINRIRLNVYEVGIAVLVFELENETHRSLDAVNAINEYGRRINFPYLQNGDSHPLCADSISIKFGDEEFSKENFLETLEKIKTGDYAANRISLSYIMKPIQKLLDDVSDHEREAASIQLTTNRKHEFDKRYFVVNPCVDDRMFVCCVVIDNALSNTLKGCDMPKLSCFSNANVRLPAAVDGVVYDAKNGTHDAYMEGWADETTFVNQLYKFTYIENELSCQDPYMKIGILKKSLYTRWIHAGTIHGVTHHSFVCLTNSGVIPQVINPFLTQYVQMAILALAQRSVILMLEDEVALLSNKLAIEYNENDDDIDKFQENLKKIKRLQATYVKVQNQLLLSEITVQEQGCEMYEMLREQLYLEKNMNDLDIGMRNLRDVADIANAYFERQHDKKEMAMRKSQLEEQKRSEREEEEKRQKDEKSAERRFNRLALLFGISSIWEPFAMMFFDIEARCGYILWFVATLAFLTVIYIWYYKDNFKKKNSNHNPDGSA